MSDPIDVRYSDTVLKIASLKEEIYGKNTQIVRLKERIAHVKNHSKRSNQRELEITNLEESLLELTMHWEALIKQRHDLIALQLKLLGLKIERAIQSRRPR